MRCSVTKSKVTALGNGADTYSSPTTNAWRQERWIVTGGETEMMSRENKHLGGTPQNYNYFISSLSFLYSIVIQSQMAQSHVCPPIFMNPTKTISLTNSPQQLAEVIPPG